MRRYSNDWAHRRIPPLFAVPGAGALLGRATHLLLSPTVDRIRVWKREHVDRAQRRTDQCGKRIFISHWVVQSNIEAVRAINRVLSWDLLRLMERLERGYLYLLSQMCSRVRGMHSWSPEMSMRWILLRNTKTRLGFVCTRMMGIVESIFTILQLLWFCIKFALLSVTGWKVMVVFYHSLFLASSWGRSAPLNSLRLYQSRLLLAGRRWYHILTWFCFFLRLLLAWYQSVEDIRLRIRVLSTVQVFVSQAQMFKLITHLTGIKELPDISTSESESEWAMERDVPDGRLGSGVSGMILSDAMRHFIFLLCQKVVRQTVMHLSKKHSSFFFIFQVNWEELFRGLE